MQTVQHQFRSCNMRQFSRVFTVRLQKIFMQNTGTLKLFPRYPKTTNELIRYRMMGMDKSNGQTIAVTRQHGSSELVLAHHKHKVQRM